VPFTVEVEWNTLTDQSVLGLYTRDQLKEMGVTLVDPTQIARDDGNGKLMLNGVQVGTVTYSTGAVDFCLMSRSRSPSRSIRPARSAAAASMARWPVPPQL
jgi:hypothetical protein